MSKKIKENPDYFLLGTVIFLIAFGILILASVSASYSFKTFGDTYHLLLHQLIWGLIPGLILGFWAYRVNLSFFKKWAPAFLLFGLVLMTMVFLPVIGSYSTGAARWIGIGDISFQPSEFLKLSLILYLAAWLSSREEKIAVTKDSKDQKKTFFAFLAVGIAIIVLLLLQSDISTLAVIATVGIIMFFTANTVWWHSAALVLGGIGVLFGLIKLAPYRMHRLTVFLNPDFDPMGIGYQAKQALIAVGSGGLIGLGIGANIEKFVSLPESVSDSIFAIFSEETGFLGAVFLISLFLVFLWRGFKIAKESKTNFARLTAIGITCWIITQSFVNIGAMIGILPLTGIPLPFISYGGSALIFELIGVGILLNISKN